MDFQSRPAVSRRQTSRYSIGSLAAAAFLLVSTATVSAVTALSAINDSPATELVTGSIRPDHMIAIGMVHPGEEKLTLTARLSERGIDPVNDVSWKITDEFGGIVFDGKAASADAVVSPGDYVVEAVYSNTSYREVITVHEGNRISVSFILNVGGLRILPTLAGVTTFPPQSTTKVFSLSGLTKGKLVASSTHPGEMLKVAAGEYRIESAFDQGNAVAVSDVIVKPGVLSAVHIAHKAAAVTLEVTGLQGPVRWTLKSADGSFETDSEQPQTQLIMKPGSYTVTAAISGSTLEKSFDANAGEQINIILDNPR